MYPTHAIITTTRTWVEVDVQASTTVRPIEWGTDYQAPPTGPAYTIAAEIASSAALAAWLDGIALPDTGEGCAPDLVYIDVEVLDGDPAAGPARVAAKASDMTEIRVPR